jgi:hypothetical protein
MVLFEDQPWTWTGVMEWDGLHGKKLPDLRWDWVCDVSSWMFPSYFVAGHAVVTVHLGSTSHHSVVFMYVWMRYVVLVCYYVL